MTDASGKTTYVYDPKTDRMTQKQTPFGTISYAYDNAGDVTSIASSNTNGAAMAYQYDQLNRLASVTVAGQAPTLYNYDAVGNLSGYSYPNGVTTSFQYDQLNRLAEMGSQGPQGVVASYAYTLGQAGNRTGVTELSGRTVSYGYDTLYRLTSETIANAAGGMNGALGYVYDSVGNRKTLNSTLPALVSGVWYYDANDRTTRITGDTYDNDGNTTWRAGIQNIYDFENRLIQHGGMTFVYDGDGNRVAKTVGGVTTSFLVDTLNPTGYAQVLDEIQSGAVTRSYTWGLELISESQLTSAAPPASPWSTSWYGYDGHSSVRYLTDSTGTTTDTYDYDAFGNLIASTGTTPNLYLFAGEQFDRDLGLYYNRARYLDTRLGRFWGMDIDEGDDEEPLSLHKYLYASGNPINRIDPSGNDDFEMASLGTAEDMSNTLNAMAQLQPSHFSGKLGIGIEPPGSTAVINGVLQPEWDTGHTFVYLEDSNSKIVSILSFGPLGGINGWNGNLARYYAGTLPGNVNWPIKKNVNTWETRITLPQLTEGEFLIASTKSHVPNYTPSIQCTSISLLIASEVGVNLPNGVGPVLGAAKEYSVSNVPNPYTLNKQMTQLYGAPQVRPPSYFQ
jgi:RHS repeat-associated protein